MFAFIKRLFFRKKTNIDWTGVKIVPFKNECGSWQVLDGEHCIFNGTESECHEFIDVFQRIVKEFV